MLNTGQLHGPKLDRAPDGTLYALWPDSGFEIHIYEIDEVAETSSQTNNIFLGTGHVQSAMAIAPDSTTAWVLDRSAAENHVLEIDLLTDTVTDRGILAMPNLTAYAGLAFDSAGDLFTIGIDHPTATDGKILVQIDQADAANSAEVGTGLGITFPAFSLPTLASDRTSGSVNVLDSSLGDIFAIDVSTGTASQTCSIGFPPTGLLFWNGFAGEAPSIPQPTDFCFGDGGDGVACTPCPCSNDAPAGTIGGCSNSSGLSAQLHQAGSPEVSSDTLSFSISGALPYSFALLVSADNQLPMMGLCPPGSGIQDGVFDGLRCVGGNMFRHDAHPTDINGNVGVNVGETVLSPAWTGTAAQAGFVAGQTRHFQGLYRENPTLGCMTSVNTTQALSVTYL